MHSWCSCNSTSACSCPDCTFRPRSSSTATNVGPRPWPTLLGCSIRDWPRVSPLPSNSLGLPCAARTRPPTSEWVVDGARRRVRLVSCSAWFLTLARLRYIFISLNKRRHFANFPPMAGGKHALLCVDPLHASPFGGQNHLDLYRRAFCQPNPLRAEARRIRHSLR